MHENQQPGSPLKTDDNPISTDGVETIRLDESGRPAKPKWWQAHHHWHRFSRRQKIIAASFVLLLIVAVGAFGIFTSQRAGAPDAAEQVAKSKTIASPLTGVQVSPKLAARPVTGIMIENSLDARPQSGLLSAGVVYEAIAEGGITRFLTLFQEAQPQYIGPVRSLRPYYIDWAAPFDAAIAHVGGSPVALSQIRNGGKDLDQFFNAGSYWRVNSRAAPHNVYTSFHKLDALNKSKGFTKSKFTGWPRKAEQPSAKPNATLINISISGPEYNVQYVYSAGDNSYKRKEAGRYHTATRTPNAKTAKIIRPKVVIALVTTYGLASDGHHSDYRTTGRGMVYIFQDGRVTKGSWIKKSRTYLYKFVDAKGKPINLNPGQTWITVVGAKTDVSYRR